MFSHRIIKVGGIVLEVYTCTTEGYGLEADDITTVWYTASSRAM